MKECPNCHTQMPNDTKFCTNCGNKLSNDQSKSSQLSRSTSNKGQDISGSILTNINFKTEGRNYWSWLKSGWIHPMENVDGSSWYGIVTLLIEIILTFIGIRIYIGKGINEAVAGTLGIGGTISSTDQARATSFAGGIIFKLALLTIVVCAALVAITYFIRYFIYGHKENVFSLINELVHRDSLSVIVTLVSFLSLSIVSSNVTLGSIKWNTILIGISITLFTLAIYSMIFVGNGAIHDKYFGAIIYVIVYYIVCYIAWIIIKDMSISAFASQFHINIDQIISGINYLR